MRWSGSIGSQAPKGLESENAKLKRLLADAMLDNAALKDLLSKNGNAPPSERLLLLSSVSERRG
jgi:hypothetical protein